jgi:poly(ribitol-phosphate) beta-N-acetylglucosaminyltransferase
MADSTAARQPTVSVIVPVWNVEPYLAQCLDSVIAQTLGFDRIEVIAVDDGSTDGSGRMLDEYASRHPQVVVVHQPNSGGPGRPRNVGLDRATGTYVFFLDADDYLGPEALERLVAMAERNESDIVLGKLVGVEGRRQYSDRGVFARNLDRANLEDVYGSGNVLKLFRRSFLDRVGLRFREGLAGGEDGDFMARVYPVAGTISVVADYDCYFARRRRGSQTNRPDRRDDLLQTLARLEAERFQVVAAHRKPGPARDRLMRRHIKKVTRLYAPRRWLALAPEERRRVFEAGRALLDRWHTDAIQRALPAWTAIRTYCLQHGLLAEMEDIVACPPGVAFRQPLVEDDRLYARYPHFRDAAGIPDSCFDITSHVVPRHTLGRAAVVDGSLELAGQAYLSLVGGSTIVELRRWPVGPRWQFETRSVGTPDLRDRVIKYPEAGYAVTIDLATAAGGRPLPRGTWSIHLSIGTEAVRRDHVAAVPRRAAASARRSPVVKGGGLRVATGEVRLRIGRPSAGLVLLERAESVYRRAGRLLRRIAGRASRARAAAGKRVRRWRRRRRVR